MHKCRVSLISYRKRTRESGRFGCHVASHFHYLTLFGNIKIAIDSTMDKCSNKTLFIKKVN